MHLLGEHRQAQLLFPLCTELVTERESRSMMASSSRERRSAEQLIRAREALDFTTSRRQPW